MTGEVQSAYERVLKAETLDEIALAAEHLRTAVCRRMATAVGFTIDAIDEELAMELAERGAERVVTAILLEQAGDARDAYAWRAGVHAAISWARHAQVVRRAEPRIAAELPSPPTPHEVLERAEEVRAMLASASRLAVLLTGMPENYRWALEQYYLAEVPVAVLAQMVLDRGDIPGATLERATDRVNAWLSRGRSWIRRRVPRNER